jgi:hypothetical protein
LGGSSAGKALSSFYTQFVGGKMSNKAVEELEKFGLLDPSKIIKTLSNSSGSSALCARHHHHRHVAVASGRPAACAGIRGAGAGCGCTSASTTSGLTSRARGRGSARPQEARRPASSRSGRITSG